MNNMGMGARAPHVVALAASAVAAALAMPPHARAGIFHDAGFGMYGSPGQYGLRLSEIRCDQQGADTDEYFEIVGLPGMNLKGWWFIAIGDSGSDSGGILEMAVNLSSYSLGNNGYFVGHESTFGSGVLNGQALSIHPDANHAVIGAGDALNFENSDNVTYMLVYGFVGSVGMDLDANNDGMLDAWLWVDIADSVAFLSSSSSDLVYSANQVGPVSYTGTGGMPAHAWWDGTTWQAGLLNSWEYDTPGYAPVIPGPGTLVLGGAAAMVGGRYHRPLRRR